MQDKDLPILPHQRTELDKARDALDRAGWHAARDMEEAYARDPDLAAEASRGRVDGALRAMQREADVRTDPAKRADRFVDGGREVGQQRDARKRDGDHTAPPKMSAQMAGEEEEDDGGTGGGHRGED